MDTQPNNPMQISQQPDAPLKPSFVGTLLLRPHGNDNLTPIAAAWVGFGLTVILIMAGLEGTVWFLISRYLVPNASAALKLPIAIIAGLTIFSLIWVTDASFIMFQRPRQPKKWYFGIEAWHLGVAGRILTILISMLITAPFLNQAIREDDIMREWDAQRQNVKEEVLEATRKRIEPELNTLKEQQTLIQQDINRDTASRDLSDKTRRADIDDLKQKVDDSDKEKEAASAELKKAPHPGKKPSKLKKESKKEYQKRLIPYDNALKKHNTAKKRATEADKTYQGLKQQYDALPVGSPSSLNAQIDRRQTELNGIVDRIGKLQAEQGAVNDDARVLSTEQFADKYAKALPENTLGNRILLLDRIKQREKIPHFQSVEGLSQALLGILFLSLLVVKFFEPESLRLYYNEEIQTEWKRYLNGWLDHLPSFEPLDRQQRMSYLEFARCYDEYQTNPDDYLDVYNKRLLQKYELDERHAELQAQISDEESRKERARIQNEALKNQLALELEQAKTQHQIDEGIKQSDHARHLEIKKQEHEQRLEKDRLEHEVNLRNAELDERKASFMAEIDQAEKEQELREKRLIEELQIEREKLAAIANDLEARRVHERQLADNEIKKQEHDYRMATIEKEIERLDREKITLIRERDDNQQAVDEANDKKRELERDISDANKEPQRLEREIKELKESKTKIAAVLSGLAEGNAEESEIKKVTGLLKQKQQDLEGVEKRLGQCKGKDSGLEAKLSSVETEIRKLEEIVKNSEERLKSTEEKLKEWHGKRDAFLVS